MATRQKLEEAALVLENEGAFYQQLCDLYKDSDALPATARIMINNHAIKAGFKGLTEPDAESLRRYFEGHWSLSTYLNSSFGPSYNLLKPEPKPAENVVGPYKHWLKALLEIPLLQRRVSRPAQTSERKRLHARQAPKLAKRLNERSAT